MTLCDGLYCSIVFSRGRERNRCVTAAVHEKLERKSRDLFFIAVRERKTRTVGRHTGSKWKKERRPLVQLKYSQSKSVNVFCFERWLQSDRHIHGFIQAVLKERLRIASLPLPFVDYRYSFRLLVHPVRWDKPLRKSNLKKLLSLFLPPTFLRTVATGDARLLALYWMPNFCVTFHFFFKFISMSWVSQIFQFLVLLDIAAPRFWRFFRIWLPSGS